MFHVGSATIIATHIEVEKRENQTIPEIKKTVSVTLPVTAVLEASVLIQSMKTALKNSAEQMVLEHIGSPDEIHCFLESPWYASQVRTIKLSKHTPFSITSKIVKDLVKKEIELFEKDQFIATTSPDLRPVIFEQKINDIRLNGYAVSDPYGKKAHEIELSIVVSFAQADLLAEIRQQITSIFHQKNIQFHSFTYAGSLVVGDLFISHDKFLYLDIGGEVTDVVMITENVYREVVSFPWGSNTLVRKAAEQLHLPISLTQALLSLYASKKLESSQKQKLEKTLDPIIAEWTRQFEKALENMASRFSVPHTIALIVQHDFVSLFKQAIIDESFAQHIVTAEMFAVVPLSDVQWHLYARQPHVTHPKSSMGALLISKQINHL